MWFNTLKTIFFASTVVFFLSLEAKEPNYYAQGLRAEYQGDYALALEKQKLAASKGLKDAQYALGRLYRDIFADQQQSFDWFLKAAEQGEGFSQLELGKIFMNGNNIITIDTDKAEFWLLKALAHAPAGQAAFHLYQLETDSAKKMEWVQMAANKGVVDAMLTLANIYREGQLGQTIDLDQSQAWTEKAARGQE